MWTIHCQAKLVKIIILQAKADAQMQASAFCFYLAFFFFLRDSMIPTAMSKTAAAEATMIHCVCQLS
jgi:hypothetical protein